MKIVIIAVIVLAFFGMGALLYPGLQGSEIVVNSTVKVGSKTIIMTPEPLPVIGTFTGQPCETGGRRPFAVMLASDIEARPLSGVAQADIVFEMPVNTAGITRMMGVYQCSTPAVLGSIRSSRLDFIPLAQGLDAVYAHFGGEGKALEQLRSGVINNVDGLLYDGSVYYRNKNIPRPHNSFTTLESLIEKSAELNYRLGTTLEAYLHREEPKSPSGGLDVPPELYAGSFAVSWSYDAATNLYARVRGGIKEMDSSTKTQAQVKNIVVMETTWSPINIDYIRVKTVGSGKATIYNNGQSTPGRWEKKSAESRLLFYDDVGKEVEFIPGNIWIEITI